MLLSLEFLAPTSSKTSPEDVQSEEASSDAIMLDSESVPQENVDQFITAFEALATLEQPTPEESGLLDVDMVNSENEIGFPPEQVLTEDLDKDAVAATKLGELDSDAVQIVIPLTDNTGKISTPVSVTPITGSQAIPTHAQTHTMPVAINVPENDTIIAGEVEGETVVELEGETADQTLENKRPLLGTKINPDGAKVNPNGSPPVSQIKWENAPSKTPDDRTQTGFENITVKTASANGSIPPPLHTVSHTGVQIAPVVSNATNTVAPLTAQLDFAQYAQNTAPTQQVAQALALVTQGQDKLQVRLDPPELGRVTVEFQFDGNRGVTAIISSENADIGSQLRERSEFFFKSLRLAGFDSVDLSFDTQSNLSQNGRDLSKDNEADRIAVFEVENQLIELDADGPVTPQLLSVPEDNLNILL